MVLVKIYGGLGNQLFQYAMALSLSGGSKIYIDGSFYSYHPDRSLDLIKTIDKVNNITWWQKILFYILQTKTPFIFKLITNIFTIKIYKESTFTYSDPKIAENNNIILLDGYWQSYKYFQNVSEFLSKKIHPVAKTTYNGSNILKNIIQFNSICIHVRRGDYANNPKTTAYHGLCDESYYNKAIELLNGKILNPKYFVFSDEPVWVKENLKLNADVIYVGLISNLPAYEELWLMRHCKHFIIANSTFSWWGAWLCENPDKIVIAPKQWFANEEMNAQTGDLIPEDWIRM